MQSNEFTDGARHIALTCYLSESSAQAAGNFPLGGAVGSVTTFLKRGEAEDAEGADSWFANAATVETI